MQYDYDYFISYAHKDNETRDGQPGFVDVFVQKPSIQRYISDCSGRKRKSFSSNRIRASLASSRFLIVLLSPDFFKSKYCAKEFNW